MNRDLPLFSPGLHFSNSTGPILLVFVFCFFLFALVIPTGLGWAGTVLLV